jgi:FkbM family methyltransferase
MKAIIKKILGQRIVDKIRLVFPSEVKKVADLAEIRRKSSLYQTFLKRDDLCFDVGANMGNRIDPFIEIGARVVAIEPQIKCYKFLLKKYGNRIDIVKKGLGATESVKDFYISNESTISSFSNEWINKVKDTNRFTDKNWDKKVSVEITTLDNLIEQYGTPKYIKIDVEGYELEVLKGLSQPIEMISFEYTVPEQPELAILCIEEIEKSNKNIECNYSVGEDMVWALREWLPAELMKRHIISEVFNSTSFGDVFIRNRQ